MDNEFLVGHDAVLRTFWDAWERRNEYPLHPVWMLGGAKGIGKATLAHNIAQRIVGNAGDLFIIDMARNIDKDGKPKTDGKIISVYTIRSMIERMRLSSFSGGWRVVLIDSLDELNTAASNAMLKLLEEPPEQTLFLLVTHQPGGILPTIRSRARFEKMAPLSISELRTLCAKFLPEEDVSTETLKLANGSFGKIADLKQSGGDELFAELMSLVGDCRADLSDVMRLSKKIAAAPELYGILLDAIARLGLANLYSVAMRDLADIKAIHLEAEIGIFKIITEMKKVVNH